MRTFEIIIGILFFSLVAASIITLIRVTKDVDNCSRCSTDNDKDNDKEVKQNEWVDFTAKSHDEYIQKEKR